MKKNLNNNLFSEAEEKLIYTNAPLAVRMRPETIEEFVGQQHFIGRGKLLRRMLDAQRLTSVIFYGPPGVGKTTLARVIANIIEAEFIYLNAPGASVSNVREIIEHAKNRLLRGDGKTVMFLDEIHRFNRAQQDTLLNDVENGVITLIAATTENPFFSVNTPLISRSTVFQFEPLSVEDIKALLKRAIKDPVKGLGKYNITFDEKALEFIAVRCDGDARRALNALEVAVLSSCKSSMADNVHIDMGLAADSIQKKAIRSDAAGDEHYNLASALQKSIRGSDPDAAIYWLARLVAGGEDLGFIARRISICASEDIGNADPIAVILAASCIEIAQFVGFPEAQIPLAQAVTYLASAPKSNASNVAISEAIADINSGRLIEVPPHLRDGHYPGAKTLGHGQDYKYPHSYAGGYVVQDYLGVELDKKYYRPKDIGREKAIRQHLEYIEKLKQAVSPQNRSGEEQ